MLETAFMILIAIGAIVLMFCFGYWLGEIVNRE